MNEQEQKNHATHQHIELVGPGELQYCTRCKRGEIDLYLNPCTVAAVPSLEEWERQTMQL